MTLAVERRVKTTVASLRPALRPPTTLPRRASAGWNAFEASLTGVGVSLHDLQRAREHADTHQIGAPEALVKLGLLDEGTCFRLLAESAGLTMVDVSKVVPTPLALRLIPERVARRHEILPISENNRAIVYATARPLDAEAERDISFAAGRTAQARVAPISELRKALDRIYPKGARLDEICAQLRQNSDAAPRLEKIEASASAIVDVVRQIITRAVVNRASDIHIEPSRDGGHVRFRVAGILEPVTVLPLSSMPLVTNRFKVLAKLDITVRARPQDGAFRMRIDERMVDVRISTLPTVHGEKLVLRVIDSATELHTLESLGFAPDTLSRVREALNRPDGLVLVTGPTGCGKTTVLYAALNHLSTGRTNIVTVEDPVERFVEGVSQIPVNQKGGAGYADVLRSVLRQDPNVIMVGEIRDAEVASIVVQAAYTGHLVMSSLHTS
ncbi:MAG: type II/IV secretion system protein, partial [Acidobacteria bacterium]|nr:type II/IV secretion system protein [Acidobacteriota bacterium]